jgi:hypothetical protein
MTGLPTILNSDTDDAPSEIIISADAYTKSILSKATTWTVVELYFLYPQNITSHIAILPEHFGFECFSILFSTDLLFLLQDFRQEPIVFF